MACGGEEKQSSPRWPSHHLENLAEQQDEVLALESIFDEGQDVKLNILSKPEDETSGSKETGQIGLFSIQVSIPVKTDAEDIIVDISMPCEETDGDNKGNNPIFRRSVSGSRMLGSITLKHLSPVNLMLVLPSEYPSSAPPRFTISCIWLSSSQLSSLCQCLDKLWEESLYMPVIYTWINWLQDNVLSHLGLEDHIVMCESSLDGDERAMSDCMDIIVGVTTMMRYSQEIEKAEFIRNEQECHICYTQQPGFTFIRLQQCKHHFCQECLKEYCKLHVQEGSILHLKCPETKCETELPPSVICAGLSQEEYERWERLSLRKGLDRMGDIVWCPRCQNPVIQEEDEKLQLAHCVTCYFSFCTRCQEPWHQGRKCIIDIMEEDEDDSDKKKGDTFTEYKERKRRMYEEFLSRQAVMKESKTCPGCKMDIIKLEGCNLVKCSQCRSSLCWQCGKDITKETYSHFSNDGAGCNTFVFHNEYHYERPNFQPRPQIQARNEAVMRIEHAIALDPEARDNLLYCKGCRQRNMREGKNNHIRCWSCQRNNCFQCKNIITEKPISKHFSLPNICKQHG